MKRLFSPFVIIFTLLISFIGFYIGSRIATSPIHWAFTVVPLALIWSLPIIHWNNEADSFSQTEMRLQQLSLLSMGFMSGIFVFTIVRDILLLFLFLFANPNLVSIFASHTEGYYAFAIVGFIKSFGWWNAYNGLHVNQVEVAIKDLPKDFKELRIAQISDLHVGALIGKKYVQKVVEMVNSQKPHLTILSGDIVDGNLKDLLDDVQPLQNLDPIGKVFYSPGNHEYYWEIEEWLKELSKLRMSILLNQGKMIEHEGVKIWVGGVTDPVAKANPPDPDRAMKGGETANLKILISHRPGFAEKAKQAGFHLQLSGHTHGGQFFPWTYVVRWVHQYFQGLSNHDGMWVYVSPGTGSWGPPIRIGTTSEITLLKITST